MIKAIPKFMPPMIEKCGNRKLSQVNKEILRSAIK